MFNFFKRNAKKIGKRKFPLGSYEACIFPISIVFIVVASFTKFGQGKTAFLLSLIVLGYIFWVLGRLIGEFDRLNHINLKSNEEVRKYIEIFDEWKNGMKGGMAIAATLTAFFAIQITDSPKKIDTETLNYLDGTLKETTKLAQSISTSTGFSMYHESGLLISGILFGLFIALWAYFTIVSARLKGSYETLKTN